MSAAAVHDRMRELSAFDHRARLIPPRCVHPRQDRLLSVSLALGMPMCCEARNTTGIDEYATCCGFSGIAICVVGRPKTAQSLPGAWYK